MSPDLVWALLVFAVVTLFTPGPNNAMLMVSGLNFGFRRGLPHLWGVALGLAVMVLAVGIGLGAVFAAYPAIYAVLKYAGAAYLLYLAWQIATAGPIEEGGEARGPDAMTASMSGNVNIETRIPAEEGPVIQQDRGGYAMAICEEVTSQCPSPVRLECCFPIWLRRRINWGQPLILRSWCGAATSAPRSSRTPIPGRAGGSVALSLGRHLAPRVVPRG